MKRKSFLSVLMGVLTGSLLFGPAWGQGYKPSRPIEVVVHSALGGGSDVFARAVVEMIEREKLLPQRMQVVNKTAAAGLEAMAYLAEKRGDDHHHRDFYQHLGGHSADE